MEIDVECYGLQDFFAENPTPINKKKSVGAPRQLTHDKLQRKTTGDEKIICKICGGATTFREFSKHKKEDLHKEKLYENKINNRRQRKQRAKERKPISGQGEPEVPVKSKLRIGSEVYYIKNGYLPEELQYSYTIILSTFFALRLCFSKEKKDFSLSIFNKDWNEFGDIVLELWDNGKLEEISAVQCKQILNKSDISISTLGSEMGKFSIKSRCNILNKMRQKTSYNLACFKLFTVSNLPVDKNDCPKFTYDEEQIKKWKTENEKEKNKWRGKQLIIPEYKKMNLLNTTDEPNDINIFRIRGENSDEFNKDLSKFMMFTNQRKTDNLKKLMKLELNNMFQYSKDIINELVDFVKGHFSGIDSKPTANKLTKNIFLVKFAELLLEPYIIYPENIKEAKNLPLWNKTVQNNEVILVKNQQDIIKNMHTALNFIFQQENNRSVSNGHQSSANFTGKTTKASTSSDLYLKQWNAKLTPLVLQVLNDNDLHLVIQVINFLHEKDCTLKFILTTDLKVDRSEFINNLKVAMNLKDIEKDLLKEKFKIRVLQSDFSLSLEEIVNYNPEFLESCTMDVLLNMMLEKYTFIHLYGSKHEDIVTDSLVLSDETTVKIKTFLKIYDEEKELKNLSYVVNLAEGPIKIDVPPQL